MATRRSKRIHGEKLSERVEDLEAEARHQALREQQPVLMLDAESKDTACKFNLLDLVPELRERVFYFALKTDSPRQIASQSSTLKAPTLALVSKQVRAEVLPIFFSKCEFVTHVYSNNAHVVVLDLKPMAALEGISMEYIKSRHRASGKLELINSPDSPRAWIADLEKREGLIASFRNVTLTMSAYHPESYKFEHSGVRICVPTASKLRPVVSYEDPHHVFIAPQYRERIREQAKVKIDEIAAKRTVFVGFTLDDLEVIAAQFRYWPEQNA
ncbi:hypothetical protein LTS10_001617 [Elasticomyces elasticus]|nr:hypothetical protein LTS10_001617 [Elasticomyces elasticus]